MDVEIEASWKKQMVAEFEKPYFAEIVRFLKQEKLNNKVIYPHGKHIFNAFNFTPFNKVKVVLIGQDPYYNQGQAHGLCFSVPDNQRLPPSLENIYTELFNDLNIPVNKKGNLQKWALHGVLLLNASLTVEAGQPMSHSKIGWHIFTDEVIKHISMYREKIVFLLWGGFAQNKESLIDGRKHLILKAPHPSPLSVYRGFYGCKHFSKTNNYLNANGIEPIDWQLDA